MIATTKDAYQLFHKTSLVFAEMEQQGVRLDVDYCKNMADHLNRQIKYLMGNIQNSELYSYGKDRFGPKFNINSDEQLAQILYHPDYYGLKPYKYTPGVCPLCKGKDDNCIFCRGIGKNISVDEESLTKGTNLQTISDLLKVRKYNKTKDTYLLNWLKESVHGVIHPNFNLHLVITFRSSCSDPNFQNVPKRNPEIQKICRQALIPRKGNKLCAIDFSGAEIRFGISYHKDPQMIIYVKDPTTDMHRDQAMEIYLLSLDQMTNPIRHSGKNNFVFPEFYGDWFGSCAINLWENAKNPTHNLLDGTHLIDHLKSKNIKSLSKFKNHMEKVENKFWNERFKVYDDWKNKWWDKYQRLGYFDMLSGFRCEGVFTKKQVCNHPIQGTSFHGLCYSLIEISKYIIEHQLKSKIILQVHDEVLIDLYPPEQDELIEACYNIMTQKIRKEWPWICVPMDVDISISEIDGNWYNVKTLKI